MNLTPMAKLLRKSGIFLAKNAPKILSGLAVVGVIKLALEVNTVAPKAKEELEAIKTEAKEKFEKGETETAKPSAEDIIKRVLPLYIPAFIYGGITIAAIIGSYGASAKQKAVIASMYALSESNFERYRKNAKEILGEKKEKTISEKTAIQEAKEATATTQVVIMDPKKTLFFEPISGRYFESTIEKVNAAVNEINRIALAYDTASLSEFYEELGLRPTTISDDLCWIPDDKFEVSMSGYMANDGTPAIAIQYLPMPKTFSL